MQSLFIAILAAITVYLLILSFNSPSLKKSVKDRIGKYLVSKSIAEIEDQVFKEKLEKLKVNKNKKFQIASKEFKDYLGMSGIKLRASEFIYLWIAITFGPMLIILLSGGRVVSGIAAAIIGFAVPPFLVKRAQKKRQNEFNKQLAESLVIMSNCIKAGFSFQQAMESIANDMQPPISSVFGKVVREVNFGVSKNEALRHMTESMKNDDLSLLVSAVMTSDQVGGNLSEVLDIISHTIKDRIRIKQEIRVLTAQGRMSGMVIGLLPVFMLLLLMLINPGYFSSFFTHYLGKLMIAASVFLESIGFLIINKIVNIEY